MTGVRFSAHALERYAARVRSGIDEDVARRELAALRDGGTVRPDAPSWVKGAAHASGGYLWLSPDGDLVCPLEPERRGETLVATTVYARGMLHPDERDWRKRERKLRRARVRAPKDIMRGRPTPAPGVDEW